MLQIRQLVREDIPYGMRVKEQAGWNQLEPDWERLLALEPEGGLLAELDGGPVGTVMTCRFGEVAWVAMMLVDKAYRSQGVGRALMTRAVELLDRQGVRSIRLDATPQGRPLYESLGFVAESTLARFAGVLPAPPPETAKLTVLQPWQDLSRLNELVSLDCEVTGTDRGKLIRRLATEHAESLRVVEGDRQQVLGFILSRPGSNARQIGPCIASAEAGPLLFADAARRYAGESVFIDIPLEHSGAAAIAASLGLQPARELLRMGRGPRVYEDLPRLWASAGPEKG